VTTKKAKKTEVKAKDQPVVTTYKGFDSNLACRGFQYEVGKEYKHDGPVKACNSGFHACEYPLHVLRYYRGNSRFAIVEQSGELSRHDDDSKIASSKIKVKAEINLAGLIKAAIEYTTSRAKVVPGCTTDEKNGSVAASGNYGAATASGDSGAATASGDYGAATASGNYGAATASGDSGAAMASGYSGAATASGNSGAATASGYSGAAMASGYSGAATASGDYGAATASGDSGAAMASGYSGAAMASGYYGAATASGRNGKARGKEGCALFLVERDYEYAIVAVWAGIAGRDGIKPDTWYTLKNGVPKEVA